MNELSISRVPLDGVFVVERQIRSDSRGFLARIFCSEEMLEAGWDAPVVNINFTCTNNKGSVRGLHYQLPPNAERKFVTCLKGDIWDVAVDLRKTSKNFLRWHAEYLSGNNLKSLVIPEGFAHGFQVLSEGAEVLYCHSAPYSRADERTINPLDPAVSISWPLPIADISIKDRSQPFLDATFEGISL